MVENDIKMLCEWKSCELQELNVQEDHIHLLVSVSPKVSISKLMGILKGKIAIKMFKSYPQVKKEALLGQPLLGTRLFCEYGWIGWGYDQKVCQVPRERRKTGRGRSAEIWFLKFAMPPPLGAI